MTDNEKAAIAAGLWEPHECYCHGKGEYRMHNDHRRKYGPVSHPADCPDMHEPANLWRALENRKLDVGFRFGGWFCDSGPQLIEEGDGRFHKTLSDAVFAALVALYDAEHPQTFEILTRGHEKDDN